MAITIRKGNSNRRCCFPGIESRSATKTITRVFDRRQNAKIQPCSERETDLGRTIKHKRGRLIKFGPDASKSNFRKSSLTIVPVADAPVIVALTGFEMFSENVSSSSIAVSPVTRMEMEAEGDPAEMFKTTLEAA